MSALSDAAIESAASGQTAYCKMLSANDTKASGAHQSGYLIGIRSWDLLFPSLKFRTSNAERTVKIRWNGDAISTESRFRYYDSKGELRVTRFGRGFPFLEAEYCGALLVLVREDADDYAAFVLNTEEEISAFLDAFGLSPTETNRIIDAESVAETGKQTILMQKFISNLPADVDFPASTVMSKAARQIENSLHSSDGTVTNPDRKLIAWIDTEYALFRALEQDRYGEIVAGGFKTVDDFVQLANRVLNRRKSRAGHGLENHLEEIFQTNHLQFGAQVCTEGNKRPDFLFPSAAAYHDPDFPTDDIIMLAAKTTCKDRWRQILNEADRLHDKPKHLITLQQGISPAQLDEMEQENVVLVVPDVYHTAYPREYRDRLMTLFDFLEMVREKQK